MKRFNITVNGKAYDVAVEEVTGGAAPVAAPAPVKATAPAVAPATAAPSPATASAAGDVKVNAPMPGTILDIKVKVGDAVKMGQPIIILEALKMENDIVAPQDGIISSINVTKGESVETNSLLATMQ